MSKWTDVRDNIVDALKVDDVTEQVKQDVTSKILSDVLPVAENAAGTFTATLREQAKAEAGWNKYRDGIILPIIIDGGLYVVRAVLSKTVKETA